MNDLISVIVPVYNVEKYLDQCIKSIINQTYRNLEIILVDDGSPDNCGKICDEYAKIDKRIKVIHKSNGGLSDARNAGLDAATGELIGFVDSDDYIAENMYEILYENMNKNNSDIVIGDIFYVDENGKNIKSLNILSPIKNECLSSIQAQRKLVEIENHYYVITVTKLYRREIFNQLRFVKGKLHEDEFIIHHVFSKATKISTVKNKIYYYRQRGDSITKSSFNIKRLDAIEAFTERILFYQNNQMEDLVKRMEVYWAKFVMNDYQYLFVNGDEFARRFFELVALMETAKENIAVNEYIAPYDRKFIVQIMDITSRDIGYPISKTELVDLNNDVNKIQLMLSRMIYYIRMHGFRCTLSKIVKKLLSLIWR